MTSKEVNRFESRLRQIEDALNKEDISDAIRRLGDNLSVDNFDPTTFDPTTLTLHRKARGLDDRHELGMNHYRRMFVNIATKVSEAYSASLEQESLTDQVDKPPKYLAGKGFI